MQGVLCPSCGAMAPVKATECPDCGTSLFSTEERTHLKARIDSAAGRTMDGSGTIDESSDASQTSDDDLPFIAEKRTAPHQALAGRRVTGTSLPQTSEAPDN